MFIDMPMFEAGAPSAYVVAQAQTSQAASENLPNQLGVCSEYRANATHSVRPIFGAKFYINEFKKGPNVLVTENGLIKIRRDATIRIVKQPSHGSLVLYKPDAKADDLSKYDYNYLPNKDYVGEDNFQFDISLEGKTLRVYYQVMVFPEDENPNYVGFCNWDKYYYKISSTTPALDNASLQAENHGVSSHIPKITGSQKSRGQFKNHAKITGSVLTFQHYPRDQQKALSYFNAQHTDYIKYFRLAHLTSVPLRSHGDLHIEPNPLVRASTSRSVCTK